MLEWRKENQLDHKAGHKDDKIKSYIHNQSPISGFSELGSPWMRFISDYNDSFDACVCAKRSPGLTKPKNPGRGGGKPQWR